MPLYYTAKPIINIKKIFNIIKILGVWSGGYGDQRTSWQNMEFGGWCTLIPVGYSFQPLSYIMNDNLQLI